MHVIGLTGSIGMGKSTAATMLRAMGIPVFDADATVHRLQAQGGRAVPAIRALFPDAVPDGAVERQILGRLVFGRPDLLRRLEAIVHPLVRREQRDWLAAQARRRARLVVLDIPLLFETRGERRCDAVLVVSAPGFLQRQRVLRRAGMTPQKLRGILTQQVSDAEKRRRADRVVPTGLGRRLTWSVLEGFTATVRRGRIPRCGKSCSTRRPRGWTPRRATGS